jgi:hypothetical protein
VADRYYVQNQGLTAKPSGNITDANPNINKGFQLVSVFREIPTPNHRRLHRNFSAKASAKFTDTEQNTEGDFTSN